MTSPRKNATRRRALALAPLAFVALAAGLAAAPDSSAVAPRRAASASSPTSSSGVPATAITIDYRDLVDTGRIVRTGQKLHEILPVMARSRALRAAAQPLLDPHAAVLNEAVDMLSSPADGAPPFVPLASWYPAGAAEPAWVALVRAGRLGAFSDGAGRLRVFLPGANPTAAWRTWYPVLRHLLTAITPESGTLEVTAWSYTHDYGRSRLTLAPRPRVVRAASWPAPSGLVPLDGAALQAFFAAGRPLAGARHRDDGGLELVPAPPGRPATLDGHPVTLADLAVAWRAVAWAGDNEAFISLDPHDDPTRATVNFGGYLEHTRLGATVLAADERFKTLTSGLDPRTRADVRDAAARDVPGFLTTPERDLVQARPASTRWVGTRFWFYPESVEIVTDADYREAEIVKARFTADAERQRDDFDDEGDFARDRRRLLSPSIRASIDDLNARPALYAAAFREFRELETVARLLGLASWLKRGGAGDLDLDALLGLQLPAAPTPPDRNQLVAANWVVARSDEPWPDTAGVRERLWTLDLSPLLDEPIGSFFSSPDDLAALLEASGRPAAEARHEAFEALSTRASTPVRRMIKTQAALQRWAGIAASRQTPPAIEARRAEERGLAEDSHRLGQMSDRLRALESALASALAGGTGDAAAIQAEGERLAREAEALQTDLNARIARFNSGYLITRQILSIAGGIDLGPGDFRIRVRPGSRRTTSPTRRASETPRPPSAGAPAPSRPTTASATASGTPPAAAVATPARSSPAMPSAPIAAPRLAVSPSGTTRRTPVASAAPTPSSSTPAPLADAAGVSWSDQARLPDGAARRRTYDAGRQTLVIEESRAGDARLIAARRFGDRIVFRRVP